ncbi:MAG: hypothetical protein PHW63_10225 [Alphaproteobacteria bacterium]|nr:hypothetical protein [Alphaproteobacteria bacterium]
MAMLVVLRNFSRIFCLLLTPKFSTSNKNMARQTKFSFYAAALALALLGAGCGTSSSSGPTGPDGGVWKTTDHGQTWSNKKALVSGSKVTAAGAQLTVLDMKFDPQDRNAIYLATGELGLVYTLDGGESWQLNKIGGVTKINSVAVDPGNKCVIYVTSGNKVFKTENCGRDWTQPWYEPRDVVLTRIAVDNYNRNVLFAGSNDGDVYRSENGGTSWQNVYRVPGSEVTSIIINPKDTRMVYVGSKTEGIWKTTDGGASWTKIRQQFADPLGDGRYVKQLVLDPVDNNTLYDVCRYGILKSTDGGETWTALNLTSPPGTIRINALAIDPKNNKNLVFTGVSTLQYTTDGGATWSPKKLPTTQAGSFVMYDPMDSNVLYLGTIAPPTK